MCGASLLLQVQSQAGDEEPHPGVDEERQTQNPRLLLGIPCQDVQVGESIAVTISLPQPARNMIYVIHDIIGVEYQDRQERSGLRSNQMPRTSFSHRDEDKEATSKPQAEETINGTFSKIVGRVVGAWADEKSTEDAKRDLKNDAAKWTTSTWKQ
jgi:hypothetical protein